MRSTPPAQSRHPFSTLKEAAKDLSRLYFPLQTAQLETKAVIWVLGMKKKRLKRKRRNRGERIVKTRISLKRREIQVHKENVRIRRSWTIKWSDDRKRVWGEKGTENEWKDFNCWTPDRSVSLNSKGELAQQIVLLHLEMRAKTSGFISFGELRNMNFWLAKLSPNEWHNQVLKIVWMRTPSASNWIKKVSSWNFCYRQKS